jgi:hypothetical protein
MYEKTSKMIKPINVALVQLELAVGLTAEPIRSFKVVSVNHHRGEMQKVKQKRRFTCLTRGISPSNIGSNHCKHEPNSQSGLCDDSHESRSINTHLMVLRNIDDNLEEHCGHWYPSSIGHVHESKDDKEDDEDDSSRVILDDEVVYRRYECSNGCENEGYMKDRFRESA